MTKRQYLTPAEVSAIRRVKEQSLAQERFRKPYAGPPYVKDGGRVLYPADLLEEWMDARMKVSDSA